MPDNNEGITIFDITTPENPSYCFITNDGVMHIERRVPISAAGYVRSYDPSANEADEFIVACKTGAIRLKTLQKAGGKPLAAGEFLRGTHITPGTRLA